MPKLPDAPWKRQLLLGVLVTGIAEVELVLAGDAVEGRPLWHHAANLLILPAFALRLARPLWSVAVVSLGFAAEPLLGPAPVATPFLVLLFLTTSLGWHAALRPGLAGVALLLLAGMTYPVAQGEFLIADVVVNGTIIVGAWTAGFFTRRATDRRIRAEVEADRSARDAVAAERERIGRDLHDSMGHALTLVTLQAGSARERSTDPLAHQVLGDIESTGREALADLHRLLRLVGREREEAPGVPDLIDLVDGVRRGGLAVDLDVDVPVEVPASASTTAYRVVQEALTNVLRHSGATRARVSVQRDDRGLTVRVTDYGRPRHTAIAGSGRGLAGLRERVALFGGAVHSGPSEDGWHLEARIPVADA